uniref:TPM domain-containing protein n=1 Tax=Pyramimonas obovata TaxID=1411642 RepID=A0A7S0RBZ3_9CHLO|mmetsp:Transcript_30118/g.65820  ORF Transcript_30118/g.65820 Transcript_30118/m.65820 type:complete len:227 (+) Transcript_30118:111-791(+)|eukprot:CAMPEP_0118933524 /NCGR_PEP_ID=MMETSP1169-20130426/12037_1 /TAXON_ID=36882 /ORGANISM="Pyramimonas obovata, Strain CCMP722" /LENGTH=226 /DNA_ID=CAMNT_0006876295 /DNA_START=84 /DNA_END=764 /DNA_ORIENTATION=+
MISTVKLSAPCVRPTSNTLQHASKARVTPTTRRSMSVSCNAHSEASRVQMLKSRVAGAALAVAMTTVASPALARLDPVNNPELLPAEYTNVIDVAGFLTPGQEDRIAARIASLEEATGFKLRVLAQNYPNTPGLAIKNYWGVDDNSIVFVADPNFGNILNFNIGSNIDLQVPPNFWTRLTSKFGTKKYWTENGEDVSIVNTVFAIDNCLREPVSVGQCRDIRGVLE